MNAKTGGDSSFSLLVAVDGSAQSDAALHWVALWGAARRVVRCVVLNAQKPLMAGEVGVILPASVVLTERAQHAKGVLDAAAGVLRTAGLECIVDQKADDDAAKAILESADAHGCHVIVVGRRGQGALRAALLGSVSASVIHQAAIPVIVINMGGQPRVDAPLRIVVACDGSDSAGRAATAAARFAVETGVREVHLLHVRPDLTLAGAIFGPRERLLQQWSGAGTEEAIADVRRSVEMAGCNCIVHLGLGDHPGEEILRMADKLGCGMIAMGTRGHGPVAGLLLGSVARYVLERARIAVLLSR